ncbi:TonB-dependent receptor [Bacteroidia bacterium]|nr:TonB-dependent receptor [Bacteroidia bacterium]
MNVFTSYLQRPFKIILLILAFIPIFSYGQTGNIQGQIVDNESGEVLLGASVQIVGTSIGAITDENGNFTLTVQKLPVKIDVTYVGYSKKTVTINSYNTIKISISEILNQFDELVVVGYGRQKKKVSTGSVSKIESKQLEGIALPDVASTMEGQMAGIIINESSGQPGASKSLLIRGVSTNGDNSPLYIVDGIQVGNIDNINPNDVESIDVLKDAASGAIYGARAANGVVIITTKSGSNAEAGTFTYGMSYLNSQPWRLPEMLGSEDYVMLTREKYRNARQEVALNRLGFPEVGDPLIHNTNWMEEIFNPASMINHRVTASLKNSYISLDYWDQNGVIGGEKSNYKRYSFRVNSTKKIKDYITVGNSLYLNRTINNNIGTNNAFGGIQSDAFAYDPITPVLDPDAQFGFAQSPWVQKEYINPMSRLFLINGDGKSDQILGNIYLEINPLPGLTMKSDLGIDANWYDFRTFTPSYNLHPSAMNLTNDVSQGSGNFQGIQWENTINYNTTLNEKHNFDVLLGTTYRHNQFRQLGGSTSNIPADAAFNPNFHYLDAGQDTLDLAYGSANVDYFLISTFGRIMYNFDEKYLFTATVRRDGSSNFGENNRFGVFPSAALGWVVDKEDFFNSNHISFLKLRASWGINGSDRISPLSYVTRVQNIYTYAFGTSNQALNTGTALAGPPNPNVKWEESEQLDFGVEMSMFNNKLSLELDIYQKKTRDLLMEQNIPGYIGATNNPISNLGEIRNRGIEASIGYQTRFRAIKINTNLNYTHFRNEVIQVAGDAGYLNGWSWPVRNTPITRMSEGYSVGHFIGYTTDGIFQTTEEIDNYVNSEGTKLQPKAKPGDIKFVDRNGDGVINTDDLGDIGNPWPKHIIGLSLNFDYKGFFLSTVFNSQIGHQIYRTYERSDITFGNYQTFWLDRWTEENPSSELPRLTSSDLNGNQRPSDFYVEDGTFLRLRNLQFGWNVPKEWLEKAKVQNLKIYLTGTNLFTLTNYRGFDPDIGTNGWILDTGIDKGFYPNNISIGGGLNITF